MIESTGIARCSSNCDSPELLHQQTTLQRTLVTWQGWRTPRLCPVSQETWTRSVHTHQHSSRAPQATKHGQCQQQSTGSCSQAVLPCPGKALCHLPGCWSQSKQGPGATQHVRGEQRRCWWHCDAGPCITHQTTGCTHLSVGSSWAALGACWATGTIQAGPSVAQPSTAGTASSPLLAL